jgi:sulfur carrier protein
MNLSVNGEPMSVPDGATVRAVLDLLELGPGPVAVEKNGEVVPRAQHATTVLCDGDTVEVVHFVGGG